MMWFGWCPEVIRALRVLNRKNVTRLDSTFNLILDTKTSSYEDSVNKFYWQQMTMETSK